MLQCSEDGKGNILSYVFMLYSVYSYMLSYSSLKNVPKQYIAKVWNNDDTDGYCILLLLVKTDVEVELVTEQSVG